MTDRIHTLIEARVPGNQKLKALEMYEISRQAEDGALDERKVLAEITLSLREQEARKAFVMGATGPLAVFCVMLFIFEVFIPYGITELAAFLVITAVFAVWFGLCKACERAIERRSMREFIRRTTPQEQAGAGKR